MDAPAPTKLVDLPTVGPVEVEATSGLKGWRVLIVNLLLAAGMAALAYLGGVTWTDYVSPSQAVYIMAGVNILLRIFTTGPITGGVSVKKV